MATIDFSPTNEFATINITYNPINATKEEMMTAIIINTIHATANMKACLVVCSIRISQLQYYTSQLLKALHSMRCCYTSPIKCNGNVSPIFSMTERKLLRELTNHLVS